MTDPRDTREHIGDHAPDRPDVVDRRSGLDRRSVPRRRRELGLDPPDPDADADADADERIDYDRRRGPGRRLSDFSRAAEEGELNREQFLFLMAIDAFKRANGKTFPAWTDVLEVIRLLGYRKTCPSQLPLAAAEDWTEKPDAPANVRPEESRRSEAA